MQNIIPSAEQLITPGSQKTPRPQMCITSVTLCGPAADGARFSQPISSRVAEGDDTDSHVLGRVWPGLGPTI